MLDAFLLYSDLFYLLHMNKSLTHFSVPLNCLDNTEWALPRKPAFLWEKNKCWRHYTKQRNIFKDTYPAAAAKSLQSCPTLCDPTDGSPPGSPVPGIFQARTHPTYPHFHPNTSFFFLIFFLLYNIVLVLPYINLYLPQVYTCSQSWTPLPPPSPYHRSGSSQCTSPKLPVSCIKPGLVICFLYDIIHVLMPFSQIIPPSLSHRVQKTVLYICVSFAVLHTRL